jgi:hypothetical protein
MIETMPDLPAGVIGFRVTGKLVAADYTDTMLPLVAEAAKGGRIRLVLCIEQFDGITGTAVWQDLKLGVEHLRSWERIAVVSDLEWMAHVISLFGWMTPGDVKRFPVSELDAAKAWAAGTD